MKLETLTSMSLRTNHDSQCTTPLTDDQKILTGGTYILPSIFLVSVHLTITLLCLYNLTHSFYPGYILFHFYAGCTTWSTTRYTTVNYRQPWLDPGIICQHRQDTTFSRFLLRVATPVRIKQVHPSGASVSVQRIQASNCRIRASGLHLEREAQCKAPAMIQIESNVVGPPNQSLTGAKYEGMSSMFDVELMPNRARTIIKVGAIPHTGDGEEPINSTYARQVEYSSSHKNGGKSSGAPVPDHTTTNSFVEYECRCGNSLGIASVAMIWRTSLELIWTLFNRQPSSLSGGYENQNPDALRRLSESPCKFYECSITA
ncbi:hypothetical protein PM082_013702 [Marasmius tenuissimus]|nr:hypothetical protein PM082_013702 [Marasmius tenuissimus]